MRKTFSLLLVVSLLGACSGAPYVRPASDLVTGTVSYRERIALPPEAEVRVTLLDVSRQDVAAVEIARQVIPTGGSQPPFDYAIPYDATEIDERLTYAIRAEIFVGGERQFLSTTHYPVLTQGNPPRVDVVVVSSRGQAQPPVDATRMTGTFSYMADSGFFAECGTGKRVPVAHEGDNAALERAYSLAPGQPASEKLVTIEGYFAQRPRMEGTGTREALVVTRFRRVWPGERCEKVGIGTPLVNTYWMLVEIGGEPYQKHAGQQRQTHLQLRPSTPNGAVAKGFGGCNDFSGTYSVEGAEVSFQNLASTMMACPALDAEQAFLWAVGATLGYEILGETLLLTDAEDGVLARFKAVYFE
jgi:uncharacterized lipoprotein YbaY/heat shock protein HslJ